MSRVFQIALHDFSNSQLLASCAALMEMLGRDSTSFRIDLQCAQRIAKYNDMEKQKGLFAVSISKLGFYYDFLTQ